MKKQTLFFLYFLLTFCCFSQEQDTLSVKTYTELSDLINTTYILNRETTEELVLYYINKAKKEDNLKEEFFGLGKFINVNIQYRNFRDFEAEEKRFINLATEYGFDEELMKSYYVHANSYFYQGLFGKAIETYYKSLRLAKKQDNLTYKHLNLKQIGYLNYFTGKLDESAKLQKQAIDLLNNKEEIKDSLFVSSKRIMKLNALELLTRTYIFAKQKDSARVYNENAFQVKLKTKDSCHLKVFTRQKAQIYVLEESYIKAKEYLEKSKEYCYVPKSIDDFLLASEYGKIHIGLKEYDKAVEVLNNGLQDFNLDGQEAFAADYLKLLAKAYKYKGNLEKSNLYFEKFVSANEDFGKIKDTIASRVKTQEIKTFQAELDAINTKKSIFKYVALLASLIILGLLFFLFKFYKTKKENEVKFNALLAKIKQAKTSENIIDTKDEVLEEKHTPELPQETKQNILAGLKKLEKQEYFLKQECSSYNVAKKINTNTSYLSKVINAHYGKNFNTYINDLRINYAIIRLKNDVFFRAYSIQSIAEELGYKSADSFTKYFKKDTGLNPSFYIKNIKNIA